MYGHHGPGKSGTAEIHPQRSFRFWRRLRQFLDLPATAINPPSSTKLDVPRPRSIKIQFECELVDTSPSRIGFLIFVRCPSRIACTVRLRRLSEQAARN